MSQCRFQCSSYTKAVTVFFCAVVVDRLGIISSSAVESVDPYHSPGSHRYSQCNLTSATLLLRYRNLDHPTECFLTDLPVLVETSQIGLMPRAFEKLPNLCVERLSQFGDIELDHLQKGLRNAITLFMSARGQHVIHLGRDDLP